MSNTAGETACIAVQESTNSSFENDSTTRPTAEQVYLKLDNNNEPTPGTVIVTDTSQSTNELQISGLQKATVYYVFCTAVDDQPLWPTYMVYNDGIDYIRATTDGELSSTDDDDDFAALLENSMVVTLLLVMTFIFN